MPMSGAVTSSPPPTRSARPARTSTGSTGRSAIFLRPWCASCSITSRLAAAVDGIEPDDTDGLDLDAEARDMRGVADGMTDRQLGTPSLGGQGR